MFRNTTASWGLTVFWIWYRCFRTTFCLHLQGWKNKLSLSEINVHFLALQSRSQVATPTTDMWSKYNHHVVSGLRMPNRGSSPKHWVSYDLSNSNSNSAAWIWVKERTSSCNVLLLKDSKRPLQQFIIFLHFTWQQSFYWPHYVLHDQEQQFDCRYGQEIVPVSEASRPNLGPSQPSVKWSEREANHPPPPSVEINNKWSYTTIHPHAFTAWCSVQHRSKSVCPRNVYCLDCAPLLNIDRRQLWSGLYWSNIYIYIYIVMSRDTF
jgi:hypothetical protein